MNQTNERGNFSGAIGFVLAAAGSAVGLGNIWRFPYLAAKDGGGVFLLCYIILTVTFGFTLLMTEIAIGRKTKLSPLLAYGKIHEKMKWIGVIACLIPMLILPYYSAIGGWVLKYLSVYVTGKSDLAIQDGYFSSFITSVTDPLMMFLIFLAFTTIVVFLGVDDGIEKLSKYLMPVLLVLIVGIAFYLLTLTHTDANGVTRTGLDGFKMYVIPNFEGMTLKRFSGILMDAMGQLFYSVSVAMGIMITYGSYVNKHTNLVKSVNHIEIFDTGVAFFAGMMIVPAVYTFMGTEGMTAGPSLMFISLPKVFNAMGKMGNFIGVLFFITVAFAALTSSVSIMEAIVSSFMDRFQMSRKKAVVIVSGITLILGMIVCFGYNLLYFDITLPNGSQGQILDVLDYLSNFCLMPIVAIATCIMIGWLVKPHVIIQEVTQNQHTFRREKLYVVMIKFVAPILLFILLLQSFGIL